MWFSINVIFILIFSICSYTLSRYLFDVRTDYILGKSNDSSSAKLSDDDIEQLGRWKLESVYTDLMKLYLSLDSFGQKDVENLIKSEAQRCKEQNTLRDVSNMAVQVTIKK